mgnify:CR=1 FL=1
MDFEIVGSDRLDFGTASATVRLTGHVASKAVAILVRESPALVGVVSRDESPVLHAIIIAPKGLNGNHFLRIL